MQPPYQPYAGNAQKIPEYDHRLLRNWFLHPIKAYHSAKNSSVIEINPMLPTSWIAHPFKTHFAWRINLMVSSGVGIEIVLKRLGKMGFVLDKDQSTDTRHIYVHPEYAATIEFAERD